MKIVSTTLASVLLAAIVHLRCLPAGAETPPAVAAEVNGAKISREQVERERRLRFPQSSADFSAGDARAINKVLLQQLVDRELLVQEAGRLKTVPTKEEVGQVLAKAKESVGTPDDFRRELESLGMSEDEFGAGTRADLSIQRLLEKEVYSGIAVSDAEVEKEYEQRKSSLASPLEVRARDIFLRLDAGADETSQRTLAENIRAEAVKDPKRFGELAKKHSQGPAQGKGGDLGYFTRNQMPSDFADAAFALAPGEISQVLKVNNGFHIIYVESKRGGEVPPLAEIRESLKRELLRTKKEAALEEYLTALRKKGKVIIYSQ